MLAFLLTAGDANSVLYPLFWLTLIIVVFGAVLTAIIGGIWLFARWHWMVQPVAGYHVHQLSSEESGAIMQATTRAADEEERARYEAVLLSNKGYSVYEIARITDHEKDEVESWLRIFEEVGPQALH
ncbi:MAG: helix-turn-helix domain-containing protein [Blastocatellia bacterium]